MESGMKSKYGTTFISAINIGIGIAKETGMITRIWNSIKPEIEPGMGVAAKLLYRIWNWDNLDRTIWMSLEWKLGNELGL